jgi:hypothetical protein
MSTQYYNFSTGFHANASNANNGLYAPSSGVTYDFAHTLEETNPWWRVDFGSTKAVAYAKIWGRQDCCQSRMDGFEVWVGDSPSYNGTGNSKCFTSIVNQLLVAPYTYGFPCDGRGRYLFVVLPRFGFVVVVEVEVYPRGCDGCEAGSISSPMALDPSLVELYTFSPISRLRDSTLASPDLTVPALAPGFTSDCQWAGAECAIFSTVGVSSGGGQYLQLPTVNLGRMSAAAGFSICLWFVFDAVGSTERLFDIAVGESNNNVLLCRNGATTSLALFFGFPNNQQSLISPNPIVLGTWRHVCVVNRGRSWNLYDDGALAVSTTATSDLASVDLTSNFIGKSNWASDTLLRGKVDEFRMYNRSLSANEVSAVFAYRGTLWLVSFCF